MKPGIPARAAALALPIHRPFPSRKLWNAAFDRVTSAVAWRGDGINYLKPISPHRTAHRAALHLRWFASFPLGARDADEHRVFIPRPNFLPRRSSVYTDAPKPRSEIDRILSTTSSFVRRRKMFGGLITISREIILNGDGIPKVGKRSGTRLDALNNVSSPSWNDIWRIRDFCIAVKGNIFVQFHTSDCLSRISRLSSLKFFSSQLYTLLYAEFDTDAIKRALLSTL